MLRPIVRTALTLFVLMYFLPSIEFKDWVALGITAIVVTILDGLIKPVLKLLFLPINVVTLGLFSVVINVFLLWLATYLVPGFTIHNITIGGVALNQFFSLLLVSFLISFLNSILRLLV